MHFIGMLAFHLQVPLAYDPAITLLSLLPAIAASALALSIIRKHHLTPQLLVVAGTTIGIGIVTMHYVGMAAMQMMPPIRYDPLLFLLSIVIAIAAAMAALWIMFALKSASASKIISQKLAAGVVMGFAIVGMHYTGMAAADFAPGSICLAYPSGLTGNSLIVAVGLGSFSVLSLTLLVSIFDTRLADQNARARADLQKAYDELEIRVNQRTQELSTRTDELARSNIELERFAYTASHDLQEPLRTVSSFAELLKRKAADKLDQREQEYLKILVESAQRSNALVEDLLSFSRVGASPRKFKQVNLEVLIQRVEENLAEAIKESDTRITRDPLPTVWADDSQLIQLFQNLISNAIKFKGEKPPQIHIGVTENDQEWTFSIKDAGIGIDPQYFDKIFVLFQRLHASSEYPGTGIGLAIAKKVVERHGGKIWVESQPNVGTTFFFTLPKH
jgi:signal transduction histidine kinase